MNAEKSLSEQHRVWEDWAQADPLWAILSDPNRKGGKWDLAEFFSTGEEDIGKVLAELAARGLTPATKRVLDFGCGVGRLTQAMARTFDRCDGVDISETMVELAKKYNKYGDLCNYHVNIEPDLALFESNSFDFIFSTIVLQHNPPANAENYIREFCRLLSPGGVAVFDMTASLNVKSLPEGSHRAELAITSTIPPLRAGEQSIVDVSVTNVSGIDWPAGSWLAAGNHWSSDDGTAEIRDDGRAAMHEGLAAGQALLVQLAVTAPTAPGSYVLQIDLVEERVTWFVDRGSIHATAEVTVRRPDSPLVQRMRKMLRPAPTAAEPAPFSMNGLPRDRVESAVAQTGCTVADVVSNLSGGFHWDGYRYFVTKA